MKRSEFYAMFITMIILFTASMSWAVSYQVSVIQPTKPVRTIVDTTVSTDGVYKTILDISGRGIVNRVSVFDSSTINTYRMWLKITCDGIEHEFAPLADEDSKDLMQTINIQPLYLGTTLVETGKSLDVSSLFYFKTSLKIEVKQTRGDNYRYLTRIDYATE